MNDIVTRYRPRLPINPWNPIDIVPIKDWSNEHIWLDSNNAQPGQLDTSYTPYVEAIMDALSIDHPCKKVVFKKSTQCGGTQIALCAIGQRIGNNPSPILVVLPTDAAADSWSKLRVDPMIQNSPLLSALMKQHARDGSDTIREKQFPGGFIRFASAGSAADLKSVPIDLAILDEVDEFPLRVGKQGSPLGLIDARLATFPNAKQYIVSSPTDKETSRICKEFDLGNQQHFYVKCPCCQFPQTIQWENIKYTDNDPKTARWQCSNEACLELHPESVKPQLLKTGKWIAHAPEHGEEVMSFAINAFYSPFVTWESCVKRWLRALDIPEEINTFINTIQGEATESIKVEAPEWLTLFNRREDYPIRTIPEGVHLITAATDIQGDRWETEIMGWGPNYENYSIDYFVHHGDYQTTEFWDALEEYYARAVFQTHDGYKIKPHKICVDTGYQASYVYDFLRRYEHSDVVVGVKGVPSIASGLLVSSPTSADKTADGRADKSGAVFYTVNTGAIKEQVIGWLNNDYITDDLGVVTKPIGLSHFPDYDHKYFIMLTSEYRLTEYTKAGKWVTKWVHDTSKRNEAIDTRVYNRAALELSGAPRWNAADWEVMRTISGRYEPTNPAASTVLPSGRPKLPPSDFQIY